MKNEALSQFEQITTEEERISNDDMTDAFDDLNILGLRDTVAQWSPNSVAQWNHCGMLKKKILMPGGVTWVLGFFKAPNCLECAEIFRNIAVTDILGALQTALSSLFPGIHWPDFQPETQPAGFTCPLVPY